LRTRLLAILRRYVNQNPISYSNDDPWYVEVSNFYHEVKKEFPGEDPFDLINNGEFHEVFTIIEIFLDMARKIYYTQRETAPAEIIQAFDLSGSVYTICDRRIELRVSEDFAKKTESVKLALADNPSAYDKFFEAVGDLVGRKARAEDVVKNIFIAFEDYLKEQTKTKDYQSALDHLKNNGFISSTQKALLEKVYAYRSDTYGVGHAGNGEKPNEIDALWFVETVTAQILFIDKKLKQSVT